jgi:hypothetical protein
MNCVWELGCIKDRGPDGVDAGKDDGGGREGQGLGLGCACVALSLLTLIGSFLFLLEPVTNQILHPNEWLPESCAAGKNCRMAGGQAMAA